MYLVLALKFSTLIVLLALSV